MSQLIPYSPRHTLKRTRRLIDQIMDEPMFTTWGDPFTISPFDPMNTIHPWDFGFTEPPFPGDNIAVDLYEKGDKLVVKASLPGVQKEDVQVMEQNGFLTIRIKNEANKKREQNGWDIRTHRYWTWQRTVSFPMEVDINGAEAVLEDGVLTIVVPKLVPHKKLIHRIKVHLPKIKLPGFSKKEGKISVSHK